MGPRRGHLISVVDGAVGVALIVLACLLVDAGRGASIVGTLTSTDPDLSLAAPLQAAAVVLALALVAGVVLGAVLLRRTQRLAFGAVAVWSVATSIGLVVWVAPLADLLREWRIAPLGPPVEPLVILGLLACVTSLVTSVRGYVVTPATGWLSVTPAAGPLVTMAPHRN